MHLRKTPRWRQHHNRQPPTGAHIIPIAYLKATAVHVVPTPQAAPHQICPPTQAGPTAGAAWQVHVAIADAAGLLLQAEMHMWRECHLEQSPSRCWMPQRIHQGLSHRRRVRGLWSVPPHQAGGLQCQVRQDACLEDLWTRCGTSVCCEGCSMLARALMICLI